MPAAVVVQDRTHGAGGFLESTALRRPSFPGRRGRLATTAILALGLTNACVPSPEPAPTNAPAAAPSVLAAYRPVDLTYTLDEASLFWPTSPTRFELTRLAFGPSEGGFFYAANTYATPEHGGTHLDAPQHFAEGGWTVDQIPIDHLFLPAFVVDVSTQASADRDYRATVADIETFERENGRISSGAALLLHTGWGRHWPNAMAYLGDDKPGDASHLHFPSFSPEVAQFLVAERGVHMLGIDTASIDYGPSTTFDVHQIVGRNNVAGLENIANLEALPPSGAWIAAMPTKIGGGSGAPVRILGLVPRQPAN